MLQMTSDVKDVRDFLCLERRQVDALTSYMDNSGLENAELDRWRQFRFLKLREEYW